MLTCLVSCLIKRRIRRYKTGTWHSILRIKHLHFADFARLSNDNWQYSPGINKTFFFFLITLFMPRVYLKNMKSSVLKNNKEILKNLHHNYLAGLPWMTIKNISRRPENNSLFFSLTKLSLSRAACPIEIGFWLFSITDFKLHSYCLRIIPHV